MTITKLKAAVAAVEDTLAHHKAIYTNGFALASRAEESRLGFMNRIMATSGDGHPLDIGRGHPEVAVILSLDSSKSYIETKAIAEAVITSPEFIEAAAVLEPLIAEVRQLEHQLAVENEALAARAAERAAAIAAATAAALAEVEAQFAEPSAPAPAAPEKPFRGKVKLEGELATA